MSKEIGCFLSIMLILIFSQTIVASCIQGDCKNGKGTYLFKDGSKYMGTFSNYELNGRGFYYSPNGISYQGGFTGGKKHGYGRLVFIDGSIYEGSFVQDVISGNGYIKYSNGDSYIGTWESGKSHGEGNYKFSNGDSYKGGFLYGEFNGHGKLIANNGMYYEGNWMHSKKHGKGISFSNGKLYNVKYELNKLLDSSLFKESSGFEMGVNSVNKNCNLEYCNQEKGTYHFTDGSKYDGYFMDGKPNGEGICIYSNGNKYVGQWKDNAPNGYGSMYFANGSKKTAIWLNGLPKELAKPSIYNNLNLNKEDLSKNSKDLGSVNVYALVVGVATYNHQQSLKYTDDDAYHLYAFLKSPEGGAIQDENIKVLIDDAATKANIENELNYISSRADANDVVLIYMSGHGLDGAFVPSDFDGYNHLLPYDNVLNTLQSSEAKHKIFITDACHSGSMIAQTKSAYSISVDHFYNAFADSNGGIAVLTSSKKEEVSLEYGGLRQGIFSHFLIRGLKGEANTNGDKLITVSELFNFVSEKVKSYTGGAQHPTIQGSYDQQMPLAMIR